VGPRTLEQLIDNLGAAGVTLTDADRARLDAIAPPLAPTLRYYDAALALDLRPNLHRW
jgi:hypothetical protein